MTKELMEFMARSSRTLIVINNFLQQSKSQQETSKNLPQVPRVLNINFLLTPFHTLSRETVIKIFSNNHQRDNALI